MTATPVHDQLVLWLDQNIAQVLSEIAPQLPALLRASDMHHWARHPRMELALQAFSATKKTWEDPVVSLQGPYRNEHRVIKGYIDLAVDVDLLELLEPGYHSQLVLAIEVKPRIESLGEVIRQIRMYQQFAPRHVFFVASPDQRYAALLREQGIGFIPLGPVQGGLLDA